MKIRYLVGARAKGDVPGSLRVYDNPPTFPSWGKDKTEHGYRMQNSAPVYRSGGAANCEEESSTPGGTVLCCP